ncbi:hypothetical protein KR054_005801 [Drosophila jambulina]|nr:hypothetical protein KR054_005801 [Drosophila jambulina]
MWMYLANRVFMSGASAHKGLPDTEDQGVLPLVVLPPRPTHNTDDDVDDDVAETIHLVNPSMNELMVAINNANQKPIIVTPPKNQIKNLNLQRAGRGFRAIGNEDSHPDSLTFMRMVGGGVSRRGEE